MVSQIILSRNFLYMSLKIYTAYKLPNSKVSDFANMVSDFQRNKVANFLNEFIQNINRDPFEEWFNESYDRMDLNEFKDNEHALNKLKFDFLIEERVRPASKSSERSPFCIDCGWRLYFDSELAYTMPYGERWIYKDVENIFPDWIEDFTYWNNTDRPDDISKNEWQERRDKWDELLERNAPTITVNVLEFGKNPLNSISYETDLFKRIEEINE